MYTFVPDSLYLFINQALVQSKSRTVKFYLTLFIKKLHENNNKFITY